MVMASEMFRQTDIKDALDQVTMQEAINDNDIEALRRLIALNEAKGDRADFVFYRIEQGEQAFEVAIRHGDLDLINLFVQRGHDIHHPDSQAMIVAAMTGQVAAVSLLISLGANTHAHHDLTFRCAARHGHIDVATLLLNEGSQLESEEYEALSYAIRRQDREMIKMLIQHGIKKHATESDPLAWAVRDLQYDYSTLRYLVRLGADFSVKGQPILNKTALYGDAKTVSYLLKISDDPLATIIDQHKISSAERLPYGGQRFIMAKLHVARKKQHTPKVALS